MGRVIEFDPNRRRKTPDAAVSDPPKTTNPDSFFAIPSVSALYDEGLITVRPVFANAIPKPRLIGRKPQIDTVAQARDVLSKSSLASIRKELLHALEQGLATERLSFITEHFPDNDERKSALTDLGKHTYTTGVEMEDEILKKIGQDIIVATWGSQRAARIIQNMEIKGKIPPPIRD